ncbi:hypothetical protein [Bradyrhizobium sp. sGM-13]|uniref:hypothetical protein n=1 Tax=Bradyrhizobium sp. sGM-13 TaxID=2831781 RepID=UPI001BCF3039|nr:hypothetical protein [Bradyrhizobium sp. sGM-13]
MTTEWGNAFQITKIEPSTLDALHRDAQRTLPPGHRYEIRLAPRGVVANIRGIAWYAHSKMADEPTWGGHGLKHGFYLIGQYVTGSAPSQSEPL